MKRLVLERQGEPPVIFGTCPDDIPIPVTITGSPKYPFISLVRVTSRAAYYREPLVPCSVTFDPRQK